MPMNPRLLRPTSTTHPEAQAWRNAVIANGGTVSGSTLNAVSRFCRSVDAAGIRDRFFRLNLFCGTGLNAVLVPLYRGPSRTGTQYGNTTDTNSNFVSGDYVETGASGGLTGNASNKSLNTGLTPATLDTNSRHLSCYAMTKTTGTFRSYIGCRTDGTQSGAWFNIWQTGDSNSLTLHCLGANTSPAAGVVTGGYNVGLLQACNDATTGTYYGNGTSISADDTGQTPIAGNSRNITVFALNFESGVGVHVDARMGGYSVGAFMSAAQAASFNTAMQAFQTALGRNV
jgi:hypothetical protein